MKKLVFTLTSVCFGIVGCGGSSSSDQAISKILPNKVVIDEKIKLE